MGGGHGRATKSELHVPPRKIQFVVTLTCPLAECHRVASDTRRYDTLSTEVGSAVFVRAVLPYRTSCLQPLPSATLSHPAFAASRYHRRRRHRYPSSFTSAHNLDSFIPVPISRRVLSCARVSGNTRPRPQTRTLGRPATIPNQKAGVTLASFSLSLSFSLPLRRLSPRAPGCV